MVPLDIRFQSTPLDEKVVWEIDAQAAELDELYDSIIGCHVTIDGVGGQFEVQVVLMLPCCEIKIAPNGTTDPNVYAAVENAFASTRTQLQQWLIERHHVTAACH